MDLVRFGLIIRALRRRRGWRQLDLALAAGVSQGTISLIERGHGDHLTHATLVRVAGALDARVALELRWRGGEMDRLLDQDHAELAAVVGRPLRAAGWDVQFEVTYAIYGANGSIDVLAWHEATRTLLVIEIKTEVTSAEATIRKLDEKLRLGARIAIERFGWRALTVSRLLVIGKTATARRRVDVARGLFDAAFPVRAVEARRWLRSPNGVMSALMFVSPSSPSAAMARRGARHRVRRPLRGLSGAELSVGNDPKARPQPTAAPSILTNRR